MAETTVAVYARVSHSDQSYEGQIQTLSEEYPDADVYADIASGDDPRRKEFGELREALEDNEYDKVAATKLDRFGRSTSEVAEFIEQCVENQIGLHAVEQGIDADPNDKFSEIILKILGAVAEMELHLNRERRQEGIERAIDRGVQFGQAPHGMTKNEMGVAVPGEGYERVQAFIREVKKGRPKRPTARFFDVPEGSIATILDRADELYGVAFDNDDWKLERARVEAGEKEIEELG